MQQHWRLLQTGHLDAATNMAIDEALVASYQQGARCPTLRIYGWKPAAFSVGYSQDVEEVLDVEKCRKERIPIVRRMTGGGAIFHQHELTYSLICGPGDLKVNSSIVFSYKTICAFIIAAYAKLGCAASFAVEADPYFFRKDPGASSTAFCFAGCEKYDILVNNKKIGGNAQKRQRGSIFQHGSIPLSSDIEEAAAFLKEKPLDLKNRVCSLEEITGRDVSFDELSALLKETFKTTFQVDFLETGLDEEEKKMAEILRDEKYAHPQWNRERRDVNFYQKTAVA